MCVLKQKWYALIKRGEELFHWRECGMNSNELPQPEVVALRPPPHRGSFRADWKKNGKNLHGELKRSKPSEFGLCVIPHPVWLRRYCDMILTEMIRARHAQFDLSRVPQDYNRGHASAQVSKSSYTIPWIPPQQQLREKCRLSCFSNTTVLAPFVRWRMNKPAVIMKKRNKNWINSKGGHYQKEDRSDSI